MTSAGQIAPPEGDKDEPPYFVVIDRALRDEGTSYHYLAPGEFAEADGALHGGLRRVAIFHFQSNRTAMAWRARYR